MSFMMEDLMRNFLILSLFIVLGCEKQTDLQRQNWEPTDVQILKAEEIAKTYAVVELNVSDTQLLKMKTKATPWTEDAVDIIIISFYDTEHFPNWKDLHGVDGGFPHYFTVSINIKTEAVVDFYACTE